MPRSNAAGSVCTCSDAGQHCDVTALCLPFPIALLTSLAEVFVKPAFVLLLVSTAAFAQAPRGTDVGIWANHSNYSSTRAAEPFSNVEVGLDARNGWGASVNHFIRDRVSLAFSADKLRGRARLQETTSGGSVDAGPARVRAYTAAAQWHFTPPWLLDLYAGGGAAYMSGGRIDVPAEATVEGEAGAVVWKNTWAPMLSAGAAVQLRGRWSAGLDVKWMRYRPKLDTTPDDAFQELRLNPVTVSLGLRLHL
jgi:outer membrane protein W